MREKDLKETGLADMAFKVESDHEVQMARKDCYTAADDAIALHKLLRNITEQQGLEGWVAAKITLAADYLNSVREHLEYQMMSSRAPEQEMEMTVAEDGGTSAGSFASSMGGGNGFANGGPGTVKRITTKKVRK